jgi:hypothetical protein
MKKSQHHREMDDFGRGLEIPEDAWTGHAARLAALPGRAKPVFL